jgi:GAF domain-containing protein
MTPATPKEEDFWTLLHDLLFGVPTSVLAVVEYAIAFLVVFALVGCVVRIWKGDRFELGPLKLERAAAVQGLQDALEGLSNDDKLKANVLWIFRDRLNEASRILRDGVGDASVRVWCGNVLTDVATALSRGGYDRHRTSLWIRSGERLRMFNGVGFRQSAVDDATLPLTSIAGSVFQSGSAYRSSDVDADRAFHPKPRSGRPYQSLLSVPVRTPGGKTIAALCVDAESRGYFDADDEFFAGCFADLIGLLLAQVLPETYDE